LERSPLELKNPRMTGFDCSTLPNAEPPAEAAMVFESRIRRFIWLLLLSTRQNVAETIARLDYLGVPRTQQAKMLKLNRQPRTRFNPLPAL